MGADERLARLLEVERRLEARVRAAEDAGKARIAAAREQARRAEQERDAGLETAARAEEGVELERHAAELRKIATEAGARVARLAAVPQSEVDRLASLAVATVLAREGGSRP